MTETNPPEKCMGMLGDVAVAYAALDCDVDAVAAYPITPQTFIVEQFSEFVADGETHAEFICVESEHSAMSSSIGSSMTGARVFTATASAGLALMHEMLGVASGCRCPIVLAVANRAISAPINIHCDHSDSMGARDMSWIQLYCENAQEAYDTTVQAFKLAEHPDVQLPVMVCLDGFITSHCMEGVKRIPKEQIKSFLPDRVAKLKLDVDNPMSFGPLALQDYYFEFKKQQDEAMTRALGVLEEINSDFEKISGRKYGIIETFGLEDAETAIVTMSSTAGTARHVAKKLRTAGKTVGVIKVRCFRPFPVEEFKAACEGVKSLVVLDRACAFGNYCGPLASSVKSVLYGNEQKIPVCDVIFGLGGRDITPTDIESLFEEGLLAAASGAFEKEYKFVGVRE